MSRPANAEGPPAERSAGARTQTSALLATKVRRFGGIHAAGLTTLGLLVLGLLVVAPGRFGLLLLVGAGGVAAVVLGLRNPVLASSFLLLATFFRLAVPTGTFPVDPFLPAFGGVLAALWVWEKKRNRQMPALGAIECFMAAYLVWNAISLLAPHRYPAGAPLDSSDFSAVRFVIIGTLMPFTMFLVGRHVFRTEAAIRHLLRVLLATAAYSAAVSIMHFHGPSALVWPRYILSNVHWPDRAVGVFNQPVVNGLVLIVGFLVAVLVAAHRSEAPYLRATAVAVAAASAYSIYLTHTRAVWLSFALVVIVGALTAKGFRGGFLVVLAVMIVGVAATWSTFISADRAAGGVGSVSEVEDRLNTIATSVWAVEQSPVTGWGIGRFAAVNTYHHQQWSPEVPWERGYGIPSHLDALGILVELGLVGLALWMTVLVLIFVKLAHTVRRLPVYGLFNRPFALTALLALTAQVTTGLTVDLRFFDFPNIVVMLLAGSAIGWAHEHPPGVEEPATAHAPVDAPPADTTSALGPVSR